MKMWRVVSKLPKPIVGLIASATLSLSPIVAQAETIQSAMAYAYAGNPTLNAQRAANRVADEGIPLARSGLLPTITGTADYGYSSTRSAGVHTELNPGGFGIVLSQTLFDGLKTYNNIAGAEAAVRAARATLRNTEQNVLFDAASAYMDVIRDSAIAGFRSQNLAFLKEEVRSAKARFDVGEGTRTDVAQAQARQASAISQLATARAALKSSVAVYRQVIGRDPKNQKPASNVDHYLPRGLNNALAIAEREHPAIIATQFLVDQAQFNVKSAESDLLPRVVIEGAANRRYNSQFHGQVTDNAQVTANLTVPIYQGGRISATVRQNKETLSQRRIEVDQSRDQVRAAVVSAYAQLEAARASVESGVIGLRAARLALNGAVEERNVGQRTTLDVLNTQQEVITSQINLASARREVVVAGYALMSAIGRLSATRLKLKVAKYEPEEHYNAVRDKWYGLRTPDER